MYKEMWKKFYRAARIWVNKGVVYKEDVKDIYLIEYNLGRIIWSFGRKNLMVFAWQENKAINATYFFGPVVNLREE